MFGFNCHAVAFSKFGEFWEGTIYIYCRHLKKTTILGTMSSLLDWLITVWSPILRENCFHTLYVETETCLNTLLSGPQPCAAKSVDLINFHVETHMTRTNPFSAHLCLMWFFASRAGRCRKRWEAGIEWWWVSRATFIVGDGLSEVLQMAANAYDCVFFRADSLQLDTCASLYWLWPSAAT